MSHPPYSPDLSPTDFHLFLSLDNHMTNKKCNNAEHVKDEMLNLLHII